MNTRTKYNRTYHLPWSHMHSDDKALGKLSAFHGMDVVVSEKMDGENTTVYPDGYLHARSIDSRHNFTRDWAKRMASVLCHDIPAGHRFVFENVAYYHSIDYTELESFCYLLSIWNDDNVCLGYDDTREYAELLDLAMPKELYRGPFDEEVLMELSKTMDLNTMEGYVFRNVNAFHRDDFALNMGKFVRDGHVQHNSEHWLKSTRPNSLKPGVAVKPYYMA